MIKSKYKWICFMLFSIAILTACGKSGYLNRNSSSSLNEGISTKSQSSQNSLISLPEINTQLKNRKESFVLYKMEWVTAGNSGDVGQTVFANDRDRKLSSQFVASDPRRASRSTITYVVDVSDGAANAAGPGPTSSVSTVLTEAAIDRAMTTWNKVRQGKIPIQKVMDSGADPDIADALLGLGYFGNPPADIVHAGFIDPLFFDRLTPTGSQSILAVTLTFLFIDDDGNYTDIDNDGYLDTAFSEIYYNNGFTWGIDVQTNPFDVETVALHEAGHGLSQGHFGKIFKTDANGKIHFAPFSVMNAVISRQAHDLKGTDKGGHDSIWGSWGK
ncbi:MAG: hypothetical protein GY710_12620 [Desulfobacteraceae bacterium]|nr:hypothetical protein [Desulfobacteraceae bacterium]